MGNLFSSFDPQVSVMGIAFSANWISALLPVLILPQSFWLVKSQMSGVYNSIFKLLKFELAAIFGPYSMPGVYLFLTSYFTFILVCNFAGLFPYVFTPSSHLSMTLGLALPLWLGPVLWSFMFQFNSMMAHLVPLGTPPALMPAMVLIESVSSIIRPLTLSIRLAANMVAGHLLLTLLGSQGPNVWGVSLTGLMIGLVALLMLECAVACIQAYVFTILNALYLNELVSNSFNKKMLF